MNTPTTPTLPGVSARGAVRLTPPKRAREYAREQHSAQAGLMSASAAPAHLSRGPARPPVNPPSGTQRGTPQGSPLTAPLQVECEAAGVPVRLFWQQQWHSVIAPAVRWFERRRWWLEEPRAERGRRGVVDHEIWRVQIQGDGPIEVGLGTAESPAADSPAAEDAADQSHSTESPTPEIYTLDVSRHLTSGRWRLLRVH